MHPHRKFMFVCSCLLFEACTQPFQPNGAYDGRLAVYAILSSSNDTQYVRLSRTYEITPGGDVSDAEVDIVPGNGAATVRFHDTVVNHTDPSGVSATYNVYVAYNFRPQPFVSYQLSATSPESGTAHGSTIALGTANLHVIDSLSMSALTPTIDITADFGTSAGAYVLQLFVEYDLTVNGVTRLEQVEIPIGASADVSGNETFQYPEFTRVPPQTQGNGFGTALSKFPTALFLAKINEVTHNNPAGSVRLTRAWYSMTQIDDVLYQYYYILNGPKDVSTIRLDVPDITNITNGVGIMASTQMIVHEVSLGD